MIIIENIISPLFINPFVPHAPILYPLKTSENRKVFCFQELEKGRIRNKWVYDLPNVICNNAIYGDDTTLYFLIGGNN